MTVNAYTCMYCGQWCDAAGRTFEDWEEPNKTDESGICTDCNTVKVNEEKSAEELSRILFEE